MRNLLLISIVLLFLATAVHAQSVSPSTSPTPVDNDVVKISTNLIQIDVTVTDPKGNPIADVRPDEIEIYENGKKQKITNFSFIASARPAVAKSNAADKDPGLQLPPTTVRPENVHRTMAIVVDDLSMSFQSTFSTRDAVKRFVREQMQEGDLVAIVRTGTGIGILQQFTTDKRLLLAAAEKIRFNMTAGNRAGIFNPIADTFGEGMSDAASIAGQVSDRKHANDAAGKYDVEANDLRQSIFITGTLGAVNYVVRGMKDLPGRKSVTLISDGFTLYTRDSDGSITGSDALDSLRSLTDLANRASVVIYTIDARGLVFDGLTSEDDLTGLSSASIEQRLASRREELIDTQTGLQYLAHQTGGFAVVNQNAINRGLQRVMNDQSYYLIGFEPDEETFDPRKNPYNKLEVRVSRKNARVRYRSGFYAVSNEKIAELRRKGTAPLQALYDALTSPFALNDISLRLNALFMAGDRRSELRSFLHIDADGLTFVKDPATGKYKTTFDLATHTFIDNGVPQDGLRGTYAVTLSDEGYALMRKNGLVYDFVFPVKKSGAYQMRVAIRDTATNKTGSAFQFVEVPNLKKDRIALSGVMLGNVGTADAGKLRNMTSEAAMKVINPVSNTAIRQFHPASLLTYQMTVYNAKSDPTGAVDVSVQVKVFSERQLVFEGKVTKVERDLQTIGEIPLQGSIELGSGLPPGNYTLQLIVTDHRAKENRKIATQFVPFEIVGK